MIRLSQEESCKYFNARPRSSQLGAIVSNQSTIIPNREVGSVLVIQYYIVYLYCISNCWSKWHYISLDFVGVYLYRIVGLSSLISKIIDVSTFFLKGIDCIHSSDSLGILNVGNNIMDYILKKNFYGSMYLFIDKARDIFHTTTSREIANSWVLSWVIRYLRATD